MVLEKVVEEGQEPTKSEIESAFDDAFVEAAGNAEKPKGDLPAEEPVVEEPVAVEEPVKAAPVVEDPVKAPVVEEPVKAVPVVEEPVKPAPPPPIDFKTDPDFKEFFEEYDYLADPIMKMIEKAVSAREAARPQVDPADNKDLLQAVADYIHFDKITTAHADFPELRDSGALKRFVDSQTGADKARLETIYTGGSSEDIIKLVTEYKEAQAKPITTNKDEKLRHLAAVKTKPTAINTASGGHAEDYDSAFEEAATKK